MSASILFLLTLSFSAIPFSRSDYLMPQHKATDRPVIGILTLPITVPIQRVFGNSSVATSYIRWLEAGGARLVPILYDSSAEELDFLLNRINGVIWTGGLVEFNPSLTDPEGAKYLKTTEHIFRHIISENSKGNYYPMWGTCLGFERMSQLFANDSAGSILQTVDAENFGINLELTFSGWLSRIFGGMRYELFKEVASPFGHLAFNNHGLGIHPTTFKNTPLNDIFTVLSVDRDRNGKMFVSTVEGKDYPFYGTQWHPEKSPWEWTEEYAISHTEVSIEFSNYLGRFFVNECKFNPNKFENATLEAMLLVGNWPTKQTGRVYRIPSSYSQITFFDHRYPVPLVAPRAAAK